MLLQLSNRLLIGLAGIVRSMLRYRDSHSGLVEALALSFFRRWQCHWRYMPTSEGQKTLGARGIPHKYTWEESLFYFS